MRWRNITTREEIESPVKPGPDWVPITATITGTPPGGAFGGRGIAGPSGSDDEEGKGPFVRNFSDGTTRVLKPGRDGSKSGDWETISTKPGDDPKRDPRIGTTINVGGRVMLWNPQAETYDRDLGPSSAPSAGPAPRYPQAGIEGGQTYTVDPYTGQITFGGRVPGTLSDEDKRQNDLFDLTGQRRYNTGERVAGEQFSAGQAQAQRGFTGGENALDRALTAGQFAATLAANQQRDRFAAEQDYQNRLRQFAQDKLAAAQAFASQVRATDPAALEAFYAAGGGNIANALAGGGNAISDNAVLPAARSLRASREMVTPTRFGGFDQPYQAPPTPTQAAGGAVGGPFTLPPASSFMPSASDRLGQGVVPTAQNARDFVDRPTTDDETRRYQEAIGIPEQFRGLSRFAFGTQGEPATGTFITGDSTHPTDPFAGGAKPEKVTVKDPPGPHNAEAEVEPMSPPEGMGGGMPLANLLHSIASMLDGGMGMERMNMGGMTGMDEPRYAFGTGYETITPAPEDEPYLREVRGIRQNVQFPQLNPYDTKFRFNLPSQVNRFFAGRQTKFGVPVEDQAAEEERYRLRGIGRGAFNLGT